MVMAPMGPLEFSVISSAAQYKLPSIGNSRVETDIGALVSYGPNPFSLFRDAATYVDRILRGAKVVDLPVSYSAPIERWTNCPTGDRSSSPLTIRRTLSGVTGRDSSSASRNRAWSTRITNTQSSSLR